MDLTSRLRSIVRGPAGAPAPGERPVRELTYEPDDGYRREATLDLSHAASALGGVPLQTAFGECLVIDRRYEGDRWHGSVRVEDCQLGELGGLAVLAPSLVPVTAFAEASAVKKPDTTASRGVRLQADRPRTVFLDLETTGLSGGAGTVAFLVGCGWFDLGAFRVRQFLLTSYAAERALLAAVAEFFAGADLLVTYNGKTFDLPVMETRWAFHRIPMPLDDLPHFDMLHPARRLWRRSLRMSSSLTHPAAPRRTPSHPDEGCRLTTLERRLLNFHRVGDVPGFEIPGRFFRFLRTGDACPLEPVLEHNRLDLISLAAVTARAVRLGDAGGEACVDDAEALALGRLYERAEQFDRAEACYRRAAASADPELQGEALGLLAVRCRRGRRFAEAAKFWRDILALTEPVSIRRQGALGELRQCAVEALAIHHEHRERDLTSAREMALFALQEGNGRRAEEIRHRLARLDRKLSRHEGAQLFGM